MASSVGSDATLSRSWSCRSRKPEPEPVEPSRRAVDPASSAGQALRDWFDLLGWEWAW